MTCPQCNGTKTVRGLFPAYAECKVEHLSIIEMVCFICDGSGEVDDEYPTRAALGDEYRERRAEAEITLREFSRTCNIDVSLISKFEHGIKLNETDTNNIISAYNTIFEGDH